MPRSVGQKIGVKNDARAILIDAPDDIIKTIALRDLKLASRLSGGFDYIHFFAESVSQLIRKFPSLKSHLHPSGMLWISWRKGRKSGSDLMLTKIIKIGYDQGLVESKTLSVDAKWSAIKFTYPKEGKVYRNSYGKLKRD